MSSEISIEDRIVELVRAHGSLRSVAELLKIDVGYLSRLGCGLATNPGPTVLRKLGLKQVSVVKTYAKSR